TVEYLDDVHGSEQARIVRDLGTAVARAGLVTVDPEHAHQLALDRLAQHSLAVENWVLDLDRADAFVDHPPAGYPLPVAVITDCAVSVAGRQSGRHLHNRVAARGGIQQRCNLLQNLARAVLRRIEPQLDPR